MVEGSAMAGGAGVRPAPLPASDRGRLIGGEATLRRGLLLAAFAGGAGCGALAAWGSGAVGPDDGLVRLLRFMAILKAAMAVGVAAAVWWRLSSPASPLRLSGYLAAAAAMAAGPGLIWGMAHLGWGALLLHGGLGAAVVMLWRDPATAAKLVAVAAARRAVGCGRVAAPQRGTGKASTSPV